MSLSVRKSDQPIRIGILGAARIAPSALIEPARARDDVKVVAVAARDPVRARAFAAEHSVESWTQSYDQLIARADIDLVYVALPPDRHREWTIATLEAKKAVLCEKPFALNGDEAQMMVEAAERTGGTLIEAFHYRFHRLMRDAMTLIREGGIGQPQRARATVNYPIPTREGEPRWSAALGGGAIMDLGCYGLHALRTLLRGEPEILSARSRPERGVDVETEARLLFPGDIKAALSTAMDPAEPFTEIVIDGSEGRLHIDGFVLPQRSGRLRLLKAGKTRELPVEGPSSYAAQLGHVVDVLHGRAAPLTGGEDAVANMRAIDAIKAAAGR